MIRLASIIETFELALRSQYGDQLLPGHERALAAMRRCRNSLSRTMQLQCEDCPQQCVVPHSCGHRSCPHCQHHEGQRWLEQQRQRCVPADYFLVTFTLPAELRELAWQHQRTVYGAMLQSSWATLSQFASTDRQLQGRTGAIAVLHTHSRRLDYHPHVHLIVPAAAVDSKRRRWRTRLSSGRTRYLFSQKALAKVFRGKLLDALGKQGLVLPPRIAKTWVVDCKAVGSGDTALVYLGRYLYRGVIRERDIVSCRDGQVTFRYRDGRTKALKTRTLPGAQFLWFVLRHVLPRGFRRARNYGFLHPNCKRLIHLLQVLLKAHLPVPPVAITLRPGCVCPACGGIMKIVRTCLPPSSIGATAPQQVTETAVM